MLKEKLSRILAVFLNIITFGYFSRRAKKKAQLMSEQKNNELTLNTIKLPDVQSLKSALGSDTNIKNVKTTISTITFEIDNMNNVDFNKLQEISTKGVIKSDTSITLLIGDCAAELSNYFKK